jgi:hypothetical protein
MGFFFVVLALIERFFPLLPLTPSLITALQKYDVNSFKHGTRLIKTTTICIATSIDDPPPLKRFFEGDSYAATLSFCRTA